MRTFIDIVNEAASFGSDSFWFNPADSEVIPAMNHGTTVMANPEQFGIDDHVAGEMEDAFPYGTEDGEDNFEDGDELPDFDNLPLAPDELRVGNWQGSGRWDRDGAWEQLAMNRGWVRIGGATGRHNCYLSASNAASIWTAVKFVVQQGLAMTRIEIEISSSTWSDMIYLDDQAITQFIKGGPRRAEAFLRARG